MRKHRTALIGLLVTGMLLAAPAARAGKETKPGVVAKCGGFLQRTWRDVTKRIKRLFARKAKTYPSIAVIQDDGTLLEKGDINLCGVAKVFYKSWADRYHFLFVFAQDGKDYAKGYNAYYSSRRNDVKGIGRAVADYSSQCGSNGVLLGFANMNGTDKWKRWIYPLLDLWPLGVIIHELGHQWIAYVKEPIKGVRLVTDPNGRLRSHWQPLVHTNASIMYGNRWRRLTKERRIFGKRIPATFLSTSLPKGFSALDKYLMGVHGPSKVKRFFAIKAKKKKIWNHFALPGNTAAGSQVSITIADVQRALGGPRVPDWRSSQKRFNAAFILVVPKGKKATKGALKVVEHFRKRIPQKLSGETDKVFRINTSLVAKVARATRVRRVRRRAGARLRRVLRRRK